LPRNLAMVPHETHKQNSCKLCWNYNPHRYHLVEMLGTNLNGFSFLSASNTTIEITSNFGLLRSTNVTSFRGGLTSNMHCVVKLEDVSQFRRDPYPSFKAMK
jgi:hypothetical protein